MESQFSHKDSMDEERASSTNANTNKLIAIQNLETVKSSVQGSVTQRRAKSNSDLGCVQVSTTGNISQQRLRRGRRQRQAEAVKQSDQNDSCYDDASQHSFATKSNLATPMRTERSAKTHRATNQKNELN